MEKETHINTYKLNQKDKEYILTISTVGESIRITCKNTLNANVSTFSRDFTLEDLKKLDNIFNTINSAYEALDYIDRALKVQKVGVSEEGDTIKINFYLSKQGDAHNLEMTLGEGQEYTQTTTTTNTTLYDINNTNYGQAITNNVDQYLTQTEGTEYIDNTTDILQNYQINTDTTQYPEVVDTIAQYTTGAEYTTGVEEYQTTQYDTSAVDLGAQYSTNDYTTNYNYPIGDTNQYVNTYQTTTETIETNQYIDPTQIYDAIPYITPVDENLQNVNTYEETTTTTTTQNISDERINKLVGDANSLKSEHQLIHDKLNALSGEVNAYKTKLELLEREKAVNEVNSLRAENRVIKQQLSELNNLRNDAAEVRVLRSQLAQLGPLRKKAAEIDALRGQLNELNSLRAKAAELNALKSQLGELNNLRAQASQMNTLKQQLNELNALRAKLAELSGVKTQLGELNNLRAQVEQINVLKQQIKELSSLKESAIDVENLKKKINELEEIKLKYEQEIRNLRENQSRTQTLEQTKILEFKRSSEERGMESKQLLFEDKPQQICVKGDIIHNTDELELITRKINKLNQKLTLNLLYKATADSDKAAAFHAKCDDAKSTLVLVETDKGRRFGGFTTCSWAGDCVDKKDEDAFIFSLDRMMIYENIPGEDAIGCYPKFGPIFLGCQIRIYDNAFSKPGTTYEKGLNFNTEEDYELTGGERSFNVREIEVYEVIPQ